MSSINMSRDDSIRVRLRNSSSNNNNNTKKSDVIMSSSSHTMRVRRHKSSDSQVVNSNNNQIMNLSRRSNHVTGSKNSTASSDRKSLSRSLHHNGTFYTTTSRPTDRRRQFGRTASLYNLVPLPNYNVQEESEEKQRQRLLNQIQRLGNHLAGCVVEFLMEEVERFQTKLKQDEAEQQQKSSSTSKQKSLMTDDSKDSYTAPGNGMTDDSKDTYEEDMTEIEEDMTEIEEDMTEVVDEEDDLAARGKVAEDPELSETSVEDDEEEEESSGFLDNSKYGSGSYNIKATNAANGKLGQSPFFQKQATTASHKKNRGGKGKYQGLGGMKNNHNKKTSKFSRSLLDGDDDEDDDDEDENMASSLRFPSTLSTKQQRRTSLPASVTTFDNPFRRSQTSTISSPISNNSNARKNNDNLRKSVASEKDPTASPSRWAAARQLHGINTGRLPVTSKKPANVNSPLISTTAKMAISPVRSPGGGNVATSTSPNSSKIWNVDMSMIERAKQNIHNAEAGATGSTVAVREQKNSAFNRKTNNSTSNSKIWSMNSSFIERAKQSIYDADTDADGNKNKSKIWNMDTSVIEQAKKNIAKTSTHSSTSNQSIGSNQSAGSNQNTDKAIRGRSTMPLLRNDSVKKILFNLSEDQLNLTNPNEAPNDTSKIEKSTTSQEGEGLTSSNPPSREESPKRGMNRNSSGNRTQRFLEGRSISRSNSGLKAFMSRKGSGSSTGSSSSGSGSFGKPVLVHRTSGGSFKRGVRPLNSGKRTLPRRQFSFGKDAGTKKNSSFGVFARDNVSNSESDTTTQSHDTRKQKRVTKTSKALQELKKVSESSPAALSMGVLAESFSLPTSSSGIGEDHNIAIPLPCGVKHDCALLFVDISGFTQLSTTLKVEKLSKTINDYFQLIAEHVQAFDGDILKYAGDAVFVEFKASQSAVLLKAGQGGATQKTFGGKGLGAEKAVTTAAACAARIIDKCTDYHVYDENDEKVATLNLHCAIGYGTVIGVHLGNSDRTEYFIIGDPIKQVARAMDLGKMGEVVASPECLAYLLEGEEANKPKVILSKVDKNMSKKLFQANSDKKALPALKSLWNHQASKIADRLEDWDIPALQRLKSLMSPYVHPVIVEDQIFQSGFGSTLGSAKERFSAEAELRDVFTVFIQPMVPSEVTGNVLNDSEVLKTLHEIMVAVNTELKRFKGQLRQYTVDDKGIVLIANFGLRGSTFPQMVERLAMPFATNVQQVLKTKLNVETKMGATYGKAYCGVVGGTERHEYAVLGPSVNLAARLMASKSNNGFLVDEEVQQKASNRGFEGLEPVKAKGYKNLVPIFQPVLRHRSSWVSSDIEFVGRASEVQQVMNLAQNVIDSEASTPMVWISAESGYGKSAFLSHTTEKIQDLCQCVSATHVIVCHVCSDADSLSELSAVGPLFLDILAYVRRERTDKNHKEPEGFSQIISLAKPGSERVPFQILGACRDAEVPDVYILLICHLLLTHSWPSDVRTSDQDSKSKEVARYMVIVLLQSTIHLDFVVWAIDDVGPNADTLSWKVIQLLHQFSGNFMLLMASRPVEGTEMNVDLQFWDRLINEGTEDGSFLHIYLSPLSRDDMNLFVKKYAAIHKWDTSVDLSAISQEIFLQSNGIPHFASQLLKRKSDKIQPTPETSTAAEKGAKNKTIPATSLQGLGIRDANTRQRSQRSLVSFGSGSTHSGSYAQMKEHMLHRMDLLTPEARTHINLGAILGQAFESNDIVSVMERYNDVSEKHKEAHKESVLRSLASAADGGIIEEDLTGAGNSMSFCAEMNFLGDESITYKFTHYAWRKNILKTVLDSWKRDMYLLLAESLEERFEFNSPKIDREIRQLFDPFKGGKKKGKNIGVASEVALKIGDKLSKKGKGIHSLKVYRRALDLWTKTADDGILVMEDEEEDSPEDDFGIEELEYILKLNVAMGRCSMILMDKDKTSEAFQSNLELVPNSKELKDRALLFPSFCGRFYANRLTRKVDHEAEMEFVYSFVEEAEQQKDKIHHLMAYAMEAELFGRHGEFAKALEALEDLRKKYNSTYHSSQLVYIYGEDYGAQCLAQSASWYMQLSQPEKALEACDSVIKMLPNLAGPDDKFLVLYPILWVLKDIPAQVERALDLCKLYFKVGAGGDDDSSDDSSIFSDSSDSDDESVTEVPAFNPFQRLFKPVTMLFTLAAEKDDAQTVEYYIQWVLDTSNCDFDKPLNTFTGSLGRNADSIIAEICLILASRPAISSQDKTHVKAIASTLVGSSMKLTKYMPCACKQVKSFANDSRFRNL